MSVRSAKNAVWEARYVGNTGTNLYQTVDANPFLGTTAPGKNGLLQDFPDLVPNATAPHLADTTQQVDLRLLPDRT